MKFTSLKTKLTLTISVTVGIIFSLIIIYSVISNRQMAIESSEKEMILLAKEYALKIEAEIEIAMDVSNTMGSLAKSYKTSPHIDFNRAGMNDFLKQVLNDNPNFLGTYTFWEPNSFDGKDNEYINKIGHDETGRFIPYISKGENDELAIEAIVGYSENPDWYSIPKNTKKEAILEPYVYTVQEKVVIMTSLITPVVIDNEFVGLIGVDFDMEFLQNLAIDAKNRIHDGNAEIAIIANEGTYAANTKNTENVGKNINDNEKISKIKTGKIFITQNSETLKINVPINIGKTATAWSVDVSVPKEIIFADTNKQTIILTIIGIISVILIIFVSFFIAKTFTTPIEKVLEALEKMSQKQINFRIETKRNDEIGRLYNSINQMNKVFTEMITGIDETASSVLTASNQLSTISQEISQRANEQAATTEEVATSMEQILSTINTNIQNAEQTGKTATKSANDIKQGNKIFVQTINSVTEISEKISIISEIADKTDILSINAAIEAARAGETGKGFSVVANEIRKLADKTQQASSNIEKLSKEGQDNSQKTSKLFERLIPEIIKSAELVNDIVSAGKEQQSGVENINTSVQLLTEITNENSVSAEEMSASAEELSAQAEQLKSMVTSSVNDIVRIKEDKKTIENKKQEEQISEQRNEGINLNLSDNDNLDNDYKSF